MPYSPASDYEQQVAKALLSSVHHLMTGAEIDLCERFAEGSCDAWEPDGYSERSDIEASSRFNGDLSFLRTLENQFAAEIGQAMKGGEK